jgi:hypothetical protein
MSQGASERPGQHGWRAWYRQRRFAVLLVLQVALLAGPPILFGFGLSTNWLDVVVTALLLTAILSLSVGRFQRLFGLVLGIPTVLLMTGGYVIPGAVGAPLIVAGHLLGAAFLFGSAALIVNSLFDVDDLTTDSILGAICGYLLLGVGWAVLFALIESRHPGSFDFGPGFEGHEQLTGILPDVFTYYSFCTLTTLGYGDVLAISPLARTLSWMEAISGQFYLAVVVAGIVSLLVQRTNQIRDHEVNKP